MDDLERFERIDEVRRLCRDQLCRYELTDVFSHENLAWVFRMARRHLVQVEKTRIYQAEYRRLRHDR
jgi:hypothetical protein